MRRTFAFSIPETPCSHRVDFLIGKAPGARFGFVLTASENTEPRAALIWFFGAKATPTFWRPTSVADAVRGIQTAACA